jgi:TolB protein
LLVLILLASSLPAGAALPGRNGRIAFISNKNGSNQVFTIDPWGHRMRQLTHMGDNRVWDVPVAFSPNGKRVAFVARRGTNGLGIYTIGTDGKHQRALPHQRDTSDMHPSFSPDGRRIVYESNRNDGGNPGHDTEIFSSRVDGGGRRQLTRNEGFDRDPCYSPNGKLIAFERDGNIFIMRADGTKQRKLTHGTSPSFRPNGRQIVFVRFFYRSSEIYRMSVEGHHPHALANTQHTVDPANSLYPDYSPDGQQIVFTSDRGGSFGVYKMTPGAPNGGDLRRVTRRNAHGVSPAWQPLPRRHR